MSEQQDPFRPGSRFPGGEPFPQRQDVLAMLSRYGLKEADRIELIDSTHDASDIRLNFIVDKKWVLRF